MKNSILFTLALLIVFVGALGLFFLESKLPNNEIVNRDIHAQLLKVDSLNASINELVLRNRANLDANYDMLVRSTTTMERTIDGLSGSYFKPDEIEGSLLEKRFMRFQTVMDVKTDHVENFKSSNSVLRNSDRYMPLVGEELSVIARQNQLLDIATFYDLVVKDVLEFTRQGSTKPKKEVADYAQKIRETESKLPSDSAIKILEFSNHVATAIDSKERADKYLNQVLNSSGSEQIEGISDAWGQYQFDNNSAQKMFRYYMIGYLVLVLSLIGFLVYRLRTMYSNLDREVEVKTQEVKKAYEELRTSEQQVAQSEKMAVLGKFVADVAHEINTPLGYISSNVTTVKERFKSFTPVLGGVEKMEATISEGVRDNAVISGILKQQVTAFRKIDKKNTSENIEELLADTEDGLVRVKEIVDALTNFSHVQDVPRQPTDVNEQIKRVLKVSQSMIGKRSVIVEYFDDLTLIQAVPNQLIQVFSNIVINAIHATDEANGKIRIWTQQDEGNVIVTIADDGNGIPKDDLERVLEPFFTTKKVGEGTGVGLSIAHRIVEAHGGVLEINSAFSEGTQVTVLLPITV